MIGPNQPVNRRLTQKKSFFAQPEPVFFNNMKKNNQKMNKAEKKSGVESPRSVLVKSDDREKVNDRTDESAKPRTEFEELIKVIKVGVEIKKIYVYLWLLIPYGNIFAPEKD